MSVSNCVLLLIISHIIQVLCHNETVKCGKAQQILDDCFDDLPEELKEFLLKPKIPVNEKDITSKCIVFQRGINCFDEYTKECLYLDKIKLYRNNVYGAKNFLQKLCSDQKFKADYLKHKDCFTYIENDWKRCMKDFQSLINDELRNSFKQNVSSTYMQFCCSRYAYENCIYNSAKFKCQNNSANYVKMVAALLTDERHFRYCRRYENLVCSNGISLISNLYLYKMFLVLFLTWINNVYIVTNC